MACLLGWDVLLVDIALAEIFSGVLFIVATYRYFSIKNLKKRITDTLLDGYFYKINLILPKWKIFFTLIYIGIKMRAKQNHCQCDNYLDTRFYD